jgi:hypothetical protein
VAVGRFARAEFVGGSTEAGDTSDTLESLGESVTAPVDEQESDVQMRTIMTRIRYQALLRGAGPLGS